MNGDTAVQPRSFERSARPCNFRRIRLDADNSQIGPLCNFEGQPSFAAAQYKTVPHFGFCLLEYLFSHRSVLPPCLHIWIGKLRFPRRGNLDRLYVCLGRVTIDVSSIRTDKQPLSDNRHAIGFAFHRRVPDLSTIIQTKGGDLAIATTQTDIACADKGKGVVVRDAINSYVDALATSL